MSGCNEWGDWLPPDDGEYALQDERQATEHLLARATVVQLDAFNSHAWVSEETYDIPQSLTVTCSDCWSVYCTTWSSENEFLTCFESTVLEECALEKKPFFDSRRVTYTISSPRGAEERYPNEYSV